MHWACGMINHEFKHPRALHAHQLPCSYTR